MRQEGRSRPEQGHGPHEFLAARTDQALSSLGVVELNLRELRMSCLPQVRAALAVAAALVESVRAALPTSGQANWVTPELRAQVKRVELAVRRVSTLHQAARDFHLGLLRVRQAEMAGYDASGGVGGIPELQLGTHGLEARG